MTEGAEAEGEEASGMQKRCVNDRCDWFKQENAVGS
jgi:hypothetical protein